VLADRRAEINAFADSVRKIMGLTVPVDVENMVQQLGGEIDYSNDLPVGSEAKIERVNKSFRITLREPTERPTKETRKRFTIAHELGHLFLHMRFIIDPDYWAKVPEYVDGAYYRFGYSEEESEAYEFAGALLMPRIEFEEIAYQHLDAGVFNLQPIADHFSVSINAVKVRGGYLGLFELN